MRSLRFVAAVVILGSLLWACASGPTPTLAPTPTPTPTPTLAPTPTPTPTPTLAPTPAPTALFGPKDTIVAGAFKFTVDKVVYSDTAYQELSSGIGDLGYCKGTIHMSNGVYSPVIPSGLVLGIRVKVISGDLGKLAWLDVTATDSNGTTHSVDFSFVGDTTVVWLLGSGGFSTVTPTLLTFPSGETVDIGSLA